MSKTNNTREGNGIRQEVVTNIQETARAGEKRGPSAPQSPPLCSTFNILVERGDSLNAQGWIGDKQYLVSINTGASITIARPDITTRLPESKPNQRTFRRLRQERPFQSLRPWAISWDRAPYAFEGIIDEFILRLDVLPTYNAFIDLGRQVLRLGQEKVSMWNSQAHQLSHLVVASDQEIPEQCETVVIAGLESPLGAESGLEESSLETHNPDRPT
jgi:hypothetical protein